MRSGYVDVEGGRIWYRIEGSASGVPLLTLHGGPGVSHDYLEPLIALGDERPVVFYDQLGAGKSDRPDDASLWTVARYVREVQAVRDALDLREVHVLGQSWGTMLAVECALTGATGTRSMVLANPCLSVTRWARDADRLISELPEETRLIIEKHRENETFDDPAFQRTLGVGYRRHVCRLDPWPEAMLRTATSGNRAVYTAMWGQTDFVATGSTRDYERADDLHRLTMPVLYLTGRYDTATPETTAYYQKQTLGSEIVVFEKSSHSPHLEEPEAFMAAVREFLRRTEASS